MKISLLVAATALLAATPSLGVELVADGGFESGTFTSFTRTGAAGSTAVDALGAHSGGFGALFSPNQTGGIYQDLATVVGQSYRITYWLGHTAGVSSTLNSFAASFGDASLATLTNAGPSGFVQSSFTVVATSTLTRLQFDFQDTRTTVFQIDDISVAAVPEPATWALMLGGFVAAGFALRRRSRALHSVAA